MTKEQKAKADAINFRNLLQVIVESARKIEERKRNQCPSAPNASE
jgi:hypothetical protein